MIDWIQLSIISHKGEVFSEKVKYFKLFSVKGEVGIYPEHTSFVTLIDHTDLVIDYDKRITKSYYIDEAFYPYCIIERLF